MTNHIQKTRPNKMLKIYCHFDVDLYWKYLKASSVYLCTRMGVSLKTGTPRFRYLMDISQFIHTP